MRLLLLILLLACLAIQYPLWLGTGGYGRVDELKQQLAQAKQTNIDLTLRNNAMQAEIEDLKNGTQALEEKARGQLNLVKKNEVLVQILSEHSDKEDIIPPTKVQPKLNSNDKKASSTKANEPKKTPAANPSKKTSTTAKPNTPSNNKNSSKNAAAQPAKKPSSAPKKPVQ
ncbi:cell division protein FtsB [Brackiella oedipodis]|uniref:cell division protein FtsB n=1 Tax=Brackiella oedipodis TaxID=124225 RepID=UPI000A06F3E3|nr:cell division protein FtsB [Brackiella oedipodis]